jgi:DNA-binding response OmpR family regulator
MSTGRPSSIPGNSGDRHALLRAITRRPAVEPHTILKFADLDVARRRVQRAGRPIDLTTKGFALLENFLPIKKLLLLTRSLTKSP